MPSVLKRLDLGAAHDLFQLQHKLAHARTSTAFGESIVKAVKAHKTNEAIKMIKQQVNLGNTESVEWCIGASTLQLINRLT